MRPGYGWWHVMWHTYGTWLPGDPRGFRNRDHRIHSSGDYKHRPPSGEHAGLHRYAREVSRPEIVLRSYATRQTIALSLHRLCIECDCFPIAIAVCRVHVHLLAEIPSEKNCFDRIVTKLKTKSSASISSELPGRVWARGDKRVLKKDRDAQLGCFRYILDHASEGAAVWRYTP